MQTPNTANSNETALIEIGPHSALRSAINETLAEHPELHSFQYGSLLKRYETDGTTILRTFGLLACHGYNISLGAVNGCRVRSKKSAQALTHLPPYMFDHSRSVRGQTRKIEHQVSSIQTSRASRYAGRRYKYIGTTMAEYPATGWYYVVAHEQGTSFYCAIDTANIIQIGGNIHFPGVAYLLMAMEAVTQRAGVPASITGIRLGNVSMLASLPVPETPEGIEIISSIYPMNASAKAVDDWCTFRIISHDAAQNSWIEHCIGSVCIETGERTVFTRLMNNTCVPTCSEQVDVSQMYRDFSSAGMDFGDFLRNIQDMKMSMDHKACTATCRRPRYPKDSPGWICYSPVHVRKHLAPLTTFMQGYI